ncbi:uncharacterized protein LOC115346642 isoform X3 [Aquila chrysaetos chrysaetos]|uniref:uncharacterized protein LOC115346642 isoform X3 n=1 Tax=Aquila chrysaetos chrysaetos TaxID=223781 RepID=UPI00117716AE|nr:uncharacterized protein LOC115346642 isoform X3 [Aquila chrysaetos chrysaetos]
MPQPGSSIRDRARMELGRAEGTAQPGRVPLSASTCHQPITDAWGTLSLAHTPPPQAAPAASSHVGRMQIHQLQSCPTTHKTAEVIRDRQAGARHKPLGPWDLSPMPIPMHTRCPQGSLPARWVCRLPGRQTSPGPFTRLPNSPAGQCPQTRGDEDHRRTSPLRSHAHPSTDPEQPYGRGRVGLLFPLTTEVPAAGLSSAMGQLWLCLLTLTALFDLAAPKEKVTAQIQAHPPAPTLYHQLMLSCKVTGDASPQEFLWEKEGSHDPLQKGPDSILLFPSFNKTHLGTYVCTATGSLGTAVATYNLWIDETKDSHVLVRAKPEQPLQNFTVCLWSYTDLTRPYSLFSYATKAQDNEILLLKPKPGEYRLYVGGKFVSFSVPKSIAMSEHVCASWESTTGIVGFWFNGKPWPRKGLQKGYTVGVEASIVLGQEQDAFGGGFDAQQSFVGEMSVVYMWDAGISTSGVMEAMNNRPDKAPIFGWRNFPYQIVGEVYLKP